MPKTIIRSVLLNSLQMKLTAYLTNGEHMAKLQITLSEEATENYLKLMADDNHAHVESDCEPSGASLNIDISVFGCEVSLSSNNNELLGCAEVELVK